MTRQAHQPIAVIALSAYALFVVYASLLPWRFAIPRDTFGSALSQAWEQSARHLSRTDFAANVLLFVPLGFLATASLFGKTAHRRWGVATVVVGGAAVALSAAIEFTQLFIPARSFAPTDVIAETVGAIIGMVAWIVYGAELTVWLGTLRPAPTRRRRLILGLLMAYAVAFFGAHVLPLDLTADVSHLAEKYRRGNIVLWPFTSITSGVRLGRLFADALAAAPIGALIALVAGAERRVFSLWLLSIVALCALELLQLPIISQRTDAADIVVGSVGALLGTAIAIRFLPRRDDRPAAQGPVRRRFAWAAVFMWVVVVAAAQWWPFGFHQEYEFLRQRLQSLPLVPFETYYSVPTSGATSQLIGNFCLGLPLGLLLTAAWPQSSDHRFERLRRGILFVVVIAVFGAIELGQLFIPQRHPDPTDILIEMAGAAMGMYVASASRQTVWKLH